MQKETISQLMEALKSKASTSISCDKTQALLQTAESKETNGSSPAIVQQKSFSDSANVFNSCRMVNQDLHTKQYSSPVRPLQQAKSDWEWHNINEDNHLVNIPIRKRKSSQLIEVQKNAKKKYHHNYDGFVKKFTFK
jgi:hypothetical protein